MTRHKTDSTKSPAFWFNFFLWLNKNRHSVTISEFIALPHPVWVWFSGSINVLILIFSFVNLHEKKKCTYNSHDNNKRRPTVSVTGWDTVQCLFTDLCLNYLSSPPRRSHLPWHFRLLSLPPHTVQNAFLGTLLVRDLWPQYPCWEC